MSRLDAISHRLWCVCACIRCNDFATKPPNRTTHAHTVMHSEWQETENCSNKIQMQ